MDEDLGKTRLEVRDLVQVPSLPLIARNVCARGDHGIDQYVVARERRLKWDVWVASERQKGETIRAGDFHVRREQLGRGEESEHVSVDMRRTNPHRPGTLDLCAKLALDLQRLCIQIGRAACRETAM